VARGSLALATWQISGYQRYLAHAVGTAIRIPAGLGNNRSFSNEGLAEGGSQRRESENRFGAILRLLKQMTVNGYYTSKTAIHQELKYLGNTYLAAFLECTHPEHQGWGFLR